MCPRQHRPKGPKGPATWGQRDGDVSRRCSWLAATQDPVAIQRKVSVVHVADQYGDGDQLAVTL